MPDQEVRQWINERIGRELKNRKGVLPDRLSNAMQESSSPEELRDACKKIFDDENSFLLKLSHETALAAVQYFHGDRNDETF